MSHVQEMMSVTCLWTQTMRTNTLCGEWEDWEKLPLNTSLELIVRNSHTLNACIYMYMVAWYLSWLKLETGIHVYIYTCTVGPNFSCCLGIFVVLLCLNGDSTVVVYTTLYTQLRV